jgi:hypothetical protein
VFIQKGQVSAYLKECQGEIYVIHVTMILCGYELGLFLYHFDTAKVRNDFDKTKISSGFNFPLTVALNYLTLFFGVSWRPYFLVSPKPIKRQLTFV